MENKIDDAAYQDGRRLFTSGTSLRAIVERVMAADKADNKRGEVIAMSNALGFADALIDAIRNR